MILEHTNLDSYEVLHSNRFKLSYFLLPEVLQNGGFHETGISYSSNCDPGQTIWGFPAPPFPHL